MGLFTYLIPQLNAFNLAYLHFVEGATAASRHVPEGVDLDALSAMFDGPYLGNNDYGFRHHQAEDRIVSFQAWESPNHRDTPAFLPSS